MNKKRKEKRKRMTRGLFLKSPETFWAYFGWHNSLCIFKTKASRGTKLCSYFCFYSLYNTWKDQLYRISRSYFYEWLFGPAKFSGLLRNRALGSKVNKETYDVLFHSAENSQRFFHSKGKRSRKTSEIIPFYLKKFKGGGGNCSINDRVSWSKPPHPGYEAWLKWEDEVTKAKNGGKTENCKRSIKENSVLQWVFLSSFASRNEREEPSIYLSWIYLS